MRVDCVIVGKYISSTFFMVATASLSSRPDRRDPAAGVAPAGRAWRLAWPGTDAAEAAVIPLDFGVQSHCGKEFPSKPWMMIMKCHQMSKSYPSPNWWHNKCCKDIGLLVAMVLHTRKAFRMEPEHDPNRRILFKTWGRWRLRWFCTEKNRGTMWDWTGSNQPWGICQKARVQQWRCCSFKHSPKPCLGCWANTWRMFLHLPEPN